MTLLKRLLKCLLAYVPLALLLVIVLAVGIIWQQGLVSESDLRFLAQVAEKEAGVPSSPMVWLLEAAICAALPATVEACSAFLAISEILVVISWVAQATVLMFVVICSEALAIQLMFVDISSAADATVDD